MSMISSQCDELRWLANHLEETDSHMDEYTGAMRQAADTILELRGDLQRANEAVQNAEHDESMAWDRVRKAEAENAKLRELVRDMWRFTGTACKKYPRLFDPSAQGGQMVQPNMIDAFEQRMNELRI